MSGWTLNTLKEYFDQRFEDSEKAIEKANTANEKRLDNVNEFRQTLTDQTATFMPRQEYTVQHKALESKIDILQSFQNKLLGAIVFVGFVLPIIVGITVYILTRHAIPTGG